MLSTHLIRRHYTYAVSPFLDIEFLQLCMSIPVEMRVNHNLYWKLNDRYYPEAGGIPSTRERICKANRVRNAVSRRYRKLQKTIQYAMHIIPTKESKNGMNPIQYWYDTNPALRAFIARYYDENIKCCERYPEVKKNVDILYKSTAVMDQLLALSVIASVYRYFQ